MAKQSFDDDETQKALDDYQEGMRLGDGVRGAGGMRKLQSLDGPNFELLTQMVGQDPKLDHLFLYYLRFFEKNESPKYCSLDSSASAFMVALAAGDAIQVTEALFDKSSLEGDDLELLAKMLEKSDHSFPHSLGFVQRRTGPPVDPLAIKARWFRIYEAYKKVPKTIKAINAAPKKKLRKVIISEFMENTGLGRSLIYSILRYFNRSKK